MQLDDNEEKLLRSVAWQNARAVLLAQERAEEALLSSKQEVERKNLEIAQQREWFQVTLSSIADAVITTDTHGNVTFLNRVAEAMTGYKLAEATGQPLVSIFKIINEKTREPAQNPITKVLADGVTVALANHTALIAKDGTERAIEDSAAPIKDASGKILGAVMVFHDVTDRRQAETALRNSEEFNRIIIDNSRDCIKILDLEGNLLSMTGSGQRMFGISDIDPYLNKSWLKLWPVAAHETVRAEVEKAICHGSGNFVGHSKTATGEGKWWDVQLTPILNAAGEPDRLLAVSRDVTERQQADEARFRLAAIVQSSDDAILSKTLEGTITTWNQGAQRMYGYTAEEAIGKSVTILIPFERLDEEPAIIQRLKRGERIEHYETVRKRKDGTLLDVSLTVSPIRDDRGKIIGASKIARDITERKRWEAELQKAKDELELRVQERTASLNETTQQLETFCYTIAHDLRSPLRAQQSFASVLLEDYGNVLGETGSGYAERIINSAKRLDQLVHDLLTYSRMSRSEIKFAKVDLVKVVKEVQETLAERIQSSGATISVGELLPVMAHEPTLNIVISNLVQNALKFTAPGVTPQINIRTVRNKECVQIWVEDNGIGISPEHMSKIFGVFQRLHPNNVYPGTGIGLALVQKGVERMDGSVGVESEPGKGSRFWIQLPRGG